MILNEAYDVLMDETERKVYDQAGADTRPLFSST
jgi:curved DNA-binding protein CbpA